MYNVGLQFYTSAEGIVAACFHERLWWRIFDGGPDTRWEQ